jgi:hypothetical protein
MLPATTTGAVDEVGEGGIDGDVEIIRYFV